MNYKFNKKGFFSRLALLGGVCGTLLTACNDVWEDHYDASKAPTDETLLQVIEGETDLSDFLAVIQKTHVFTNGKRSVVTFADLLDSDQSLTVWAPKNGTFDRDSLLRECETLKGDSMCGQHFVMNHIARYARNTNSHTNTLLMMLNDKWLTATQAAFGFAALEANRTNMPAKNGLLNVINAYVPYAYTVYEGITSVPSYSHLGSFFLSYDKKELDENASIQCGLVDGMKVYSDSVMRHYNIFFNAFGQINCEDSNFVMLMPDSLSWKQAYNEALDYFNFGSVLAADSLQRLWTHVSLLYDLFYNKNVGCAAEADSVYSTSYYRAEPEYHVYYRPLDAGGLFSPTYVSSKMICSNGAIYNLTSWPFTPEQLYYLPVKSEAEYQFRMTSSKDCSFNYRSSSADSISYGYLDIVPKSASSNWSITLDVPNSLSAEYDICAVVLPKTVYRANSKDFKPNKFKATLFYVDEEGTKQSIAFNDEVKNNPYRVDTVKIGRFHLPTCNYGQVNTTVSLQIDCSIGKRETSYSREMFLDCVYLRPVSKEE